MKTSRLQGPTCRYVSTWDLRPHVILEPSLWRQAIETFTLPSQVAILAFWCSGVVVQSVEMVGTNGSSRKILLTCYMACRSFGAVPHVRVCHEAAGESQPA